MKLTRSPIKPVGSVMIVDEGLMVRVSPPEGPPQGHKRVSFLHYFSSTKIHRYSGRAEQFLEVGNGLIFDGDPHTIEYDPNRSYFPADRARREEIFARRKRQLESAGLCPVLNYTI